MSVEIGREAAVEEDEQSSSPLKRLGLVLACWIVATPFVAVGLILGFEDGFGRTASALSTIAMDNPLALPVALLGGAVGALVGAALVGAGLALIGFLLTYVHRRTRRP